jgi:hypothetical protein
VEEHEHGACLWRVRTRLRLSFTGTLRGVALAVLVAGGMSASIFIYDPIETLVVSVIGVVAIGAWAAWQALRGAAVLDRAIERVAAAAKMTELTVTGAAASREPEPEPELHAPSPELGVPPSIRRSVGRADGAVGGVSRMRPFQ